MVPFLVVIWDIIYILIKIKITSNSKIQRQLMAIVLLTVHVIVDVLEQQDNEGKNILYILGIYIINIIDIF